MKLEVLPILLLKCLNCRLHLPLELKENMAAETFAELRKLLQKATVVRSQHNEDVHWDFFRVLDQGSDLLLKSLFQVELLIVDHQSLLYVALLLGKHRLLLQEHLLVDA